MDNIYEMTLLLDLYGQMLTTRQLEIMDLHYNNDLTLAEISQQLGISRQGVHDNIKRGKAILNEYEVKLGLLEKFMMQKKQAIQALELIYSIDKNNISEDLSRRLVNIEDLIKDIIKTV